VGGGAWIKSVSCASPGNCAAGGTYGDSSHHAQGFVVSEVSGSWGKALEVPGLAALNTAGVAVVWSVSCPSAGNCAAGGYYRVYSGGVQTSRGFVVSQRNGTWGKARRVSGPSAWVESVSCPSAGNCGAGGFYLDSSGHGQGFVLSQRDGVWGKALTVPGLAGLAARSSAVTSVSCPAAGECAAGGRYIDQASAQGLLLREHNGVWRNAIDVPGLRTLNAGLNAGVLSVSCASAGNCGVGGYYNDTPGHSQGFVVSQRNGTWRPAQPVNFAGGAQILSVSCLSAGNCGAGGLYSDSSGHSQGLVVSQVNGVWGTALEVPGLGTLNVGWAYVGSVSCPAAGECGAGGGYQSPSGSEGFVVSQT